MIDKHKYHILLFFLSIPFLFMTTKNWVSDHTEFTGPAYPYLVLFAAIAEVYFSRRKLVRLGMFGMGIFVLGVFLNIPHWPGAKLCVFAGTTCFMIIPLWNAILSKEMKPLRIIVSIWILLYGVGFIFRVLSAPGAGLFAICSMLFLPVVTIALGISLWKSKQKHNHGNV